MNTNLLDRQLARAPLALVLAGLLAGPAAPSIVAATTAAASGKSPSAVASTIVVTNCDDAGPGSVRTAFLAAVDGTTIDLSQLACSTITLTTGALIDQGGAVQSGPNGVRIRGNKQTIDAQGLSRVLVHNGSNRLVLEGLELTNGRYSGIYGGGCVYSYGDVLLQRATVESCNMYGLYDGPARGGAIYSHGEVSLFDNSAIRASTASAIHYGSAEGGGVWARNVRLDRSVISANNAIGKLTASRGGGVFATDPNGNFPALDMDYSTLSANYAVIGGGGYADGDAQVAYSTIASNVALGNGAGLFVLQKPTTGTQTSIAASTISGNFATVDGGGLFLDAAATLKNCTVTDNIGFHSGGGIFLKRTHTIENSIVALNIAEEISSSDDIGGSAVIDGHANIVISSKVVLPEDTLAADPKLAPLADNGGRTLTHALLPDSPAIDHGTAGNSQYYWDQRGAGYERTAGAQSDIGAYERQDRLFANGFEPEA